MKLSDIILEQNGKPKAVIMAGGAGAGKSYLLNQLGLEGLKLYNPENVNIFRLNNGQYLPLIELKLESSDNEKSIKLDGNKYIQANGNDTIITNNNTGRIRLIRLS